MIYVFDVDGTLTPSRQPIDKEFELWFLNFIQNHEVHLATGSDYLKTLEQLGQEICESVAAVYACSGNDIWEKGINKYRSDWSIPGELELFLWKLLQHSQYPIRTGNHIERRPGTLNFSIVGRSANIPQRQNYVNWDKETCERAQLAELIESEFPDLYTSLGGETGIDIGPQGQDKRQIADFFLYTQYVVFVGDRMEPGGNDYPLANAIKTGESIAVTNWKDTWQYLLTNTQ